MEHLKTIMEKLDDMKLSEKVMNDGDYKILMEELKSAYDLHKVGQFVRILKIEPKINLYWKTKYDSGFHTHHKWAHDSNCDSDCECGNCEGNFPLQQTEFSVELKKRTHILKIVPDSDYNRGKRINFVEDTIEKTTYEKLKEDKIGGSENHIMYVFMNDVE